MLSTIFGVSIFGVVVTISAFMAGLGVGSLVGGKYQSTIRNPLLVFALIEFAVALFAFNLPSIFSTVDTLIQGLTETTGYAAWIATQAVITFFLMFIPAFGLGFGFPLILKTVVKNNISVGLVYSLNTFGGMVGALLPLALLPVFGWVVSDRLVAVLGFILAALIFIMSYFFRAQHATSVKLPRSPVAWKTLFLYAMVGAAAIMLEIGWTRLYGMILLRTEYVLAVILATFLLGIGLGSLMAAKVSTTRWLILLPMVIVASALSSVYLLPAVSAWAETVTYTSLFASMLEQGGVIALFTLPATLAFGAWLPILVSAHRNTEASGAYLYGANSIGGAVGGLVAGFILIPYLGTNAVIAFSTLLVMLVSVHWVKQTWFKWTPAITLILFVPILNLSPVSDLLPAAHGDSINLQVYEDALAVTHVVEDKTGQRLLLADLQRMDASTDPDAVTVQKNQSRLPLLLHPDPKSVLFLGLGTGITASGSLPYSELERTAVELSEGAIGSASTWFSESNNQVSEQLTIIRDDARRYLKSTEKKYDVIVGDLFHPDLVGRSNLLSKQQFKRVAARLKSGGIFVQWLALNQFDVETLKVVLATFKTGFSQSMLFVDGFRLVLVGFNGEMSGVESIKQSLSRLSAAGKSEITGGEGLWTWAGRYWGGVPANDWGIQDEWAPIIEFQLPQAKFNRQMDLAKLLQFLMSMRASLPAAKVAMKVSEKDAPYFEAGYQATALYYRSWLAYFAGKTRESQELLSAAYSLNPDDQWIGFGVADAMYASIDQAVNGGMDEREALEKILEVRPNHIAALKRLMLLEKAEGNIARAEKLKATILQISPLEKILG